MEYNPLIPELFVTNLEKSLQLYKILGFEIMYTRTRFAFISLDGSQVMLEEMDLNSKWKRKNLRYPFGNGVNFQIYVRGIEKLYKKIVRSDIKIFSTIGINEYKTDKKIVKQKEFLVEDLDGYLFRFAEIIE